MQTHVLAGVRVLCMLYTHAAKHNLVRAAAQTWGRRCDGFLAASTKTDRKIGAVDLPHLGNESASNMFQKTRSMLVYVHEHYRGDFDFFHIMGDDMFVVPENLRAHLASARMRAAGGGEGYPVPMLLGSLWPQTFGNWFCGGGSGYVLNRAALVALIPVLTNSSNRGFQRCRADSMVRAEDRYIANCLRQINVSCTEFDVEGERRFHGVSAVNLAKETLPGNRYMRGQLQKLKAAFGYKLGIAGVSKESITFHHIRSEQAMWRMHALVYNGSWLRDLCRSLKRREINGSGGQLVSQVVAPAGVTGLPALWVGTGMKPLHPRVKQQGS